MCRYVLSVFLLCSGSIYGVISDTASKEHTPQIVLADGTPLTDCIAVEHGLDFTVAIRKDGTVWGWGNNTHGQLGIGTTSKTIAAQIETLSGPLGNVTSISCDELSTTAIRDDGTSWKSGDESLLAPWFQRSEQNLVTKLSHKKDHNNNNQSRHNQTDNNNTQAFVSSQKTIMAEGEDDPWENNPLDPAPEEPFSLSVIATGPYRAPANVEIVVSVTHSARTTISKIEFYNGATLLGTVTDLPYEFAYEKVPQGNYNITAIATDSEGNTISATTEFQVAPPNRYNRGFGTDQRYLSSIIALDFEGGIFLDQTKDFNALFPPSIYSNYPWFLRTTSFPNEPCYHISCDANNSISYLPVDSIPNDHNGQTTGGQPPMVAFGVQGGGTPLYINKPYHFGIATGGQNPTLTNNYPDIKIEVFDPDSLANGAAHIPPVYTQTYTLPRTGDPKTFSQSDQNGSIIDYHLVTSYNNKTIDFDTQVQLVDALSSHDAWGEDPSSKAHPLIITHKAANSSFYYRVSIMGDTKSSDPNDTTFYFLARSNDQITQTYNISYTLDFSDPSSWQNTFINLPHFQGTPVPSGYQGKSVDELIHQAPTVVDTLSDPADISFNLTQLNNSPELKTHPELDQLVANYNNDPIALANYVINEIELTDALGFNSANTTTSDFSINPQGVSRDALGTYLEKEGSPIEQCSLLIYLLRQAGVPAAYVFPDHNQTLMFDEQLSKLLKIQVRAAVDDQGNQHYTELIPINYPWVAAYINEKWVHIFPWLKDTKVTEGEDLWQFFPGGYQTETQWLLHYLQSDPNIRSLSTEDNLGTLFPLYAKQQLSISNFTLDNVGMQYVNTPHYYNDWDDFPRPWQTPLISNANLAQNLDAMQNPSLASTLANIFDTIEIKIGSLQVNQSTGNIITNPLIGTGPMRLADLHNRRLLLYHKLVPGSNPPQFTMILSLEPYDTSMPADSAQSYTFNSGDAPDPTSDLLRSAQQVPKILSENDNTFVYHIDYLRNQQAGIVNSDRDYEAQFPGIYNFTTFGHDGIFQKGEMVCLSLNYGRVTDKMQDFEAKKYWDYQQEVSANPNNIIDPEQGIGQLLQILGQNYYYKTTDFKNFIEPLTKKEIISFIAQGFVKLSPERNADNSLKIINKNGISDLNLGYPSVDMQFEDATYLHNRTSHLESGAIANNEHALMTGENSANEHRVINEFFDQNDAVSTVKLLDIAQANSTAGQGSGIISLSRADFGALLNTEYASAPGTVTPSPGSSCPTSATASLINWLIFTGYYNLIYNAILDPFTIVLMTPAPVIANGQAGDPYVGMGIFELGQGGGAALIAKMHLVANPDGSIHLAENASNPFSPPWSAFVENGGIKFDSSSSLLCDNTHISHGGAGGLLGTLMCPGSSTPTWLESCTLTPSADGGYIFKTMTGTPDNPTSASAGENPDTVADNVEVGSELFSPDIVSRLFEWNQNALNGNSILFDKGSDVASVFKKEQNFGNTGAPSFYGTLRNFVADPVNVVTGEFYINTLDLTLEGPMPLEIRRLYSSQSLSENNIGAGWKLGTFAYLMLSADGTNRTPPSLIYAVETDGSVIAYLYNASQNNWAPAPGKNPNLINENDGRPGPSKNFFNNCITTNGSGTYILKGSDGSTRTYVTSSFPILGSPDITRTRPYLSTWQDNQGNSMRFSFGQNNKANDWGQLNAITSSNGSSIHFSYDHLGHITEAFGSDGRHLIYSYDNNGDLIKVILPDKSVITYGYQHQNTLASTGAAAASYSTHLLTQVTKAGGRILQNSYDNASRMVVSQAATVGISPIPTQTAHFDYNHASRNGGFISGNSTVTDINGNRTDYLYTENQLTATIYPPNSSGARAGISQTWNTDTKTLASRTDRRGLTTSYVYDNQGNLRGTRGNDGYNIDITYNSLNLRTSMTDGLGNGTLYGYGDSSHPYNPTSITKTSGGAATSFTQLAYQNSGGACGLLSSLNANGAVTSYTYDSLGFLTSKTQQTGTDDPGITTTISCNPRGEIVSEINNLGEKIIHDYDMMGRPIFEETFDAAGNPINWHSAYYNANGEIEWEQGNRFNPVDYIYYSYDRAGHLLHKGTWLSAANPDGSGVSAAGIADMAYTYDGYGNNTSITDPNGNVTSMSYDALGEMITRSSGDGAASESFSYEPGGLVTSHTTVLGGIESNTYTARGLLQSATHPDGTTSSYNYDASGRLVSEILPSGSSWNISYNGNTITKSFSDASGSTLATKTETFDGNGNPIHWTDNTGNTFQASYDGLNRIKSFQGPSVPGSSAPQSETYHYGANSITTVNAFSEWNTTYLDALQRPLQTTLHNSDGSVAYKKTNWYAPDHQSVISFEGEGNNLITTTTYADTLGNPLLIKHADGSYQRYVYDANGNNTFFIDEEGVTTSTTYDALNHLASQTLPGGATMRYIFNAAGELLVRAMPGGIAEGNNYNQAGEKIATVLMASDGSQTCGNTYTYSNGLVSSITDPRGFTTSISYDGWGHPVSLISRGSTVPEQNQNTFCSYDPRGLLTSISQSYANPATGPSTAVLRSYDAYGQLIHETTALNGKKISDWKQAWNGAGRRTTLNWIADKQGTGAQYAFNYNALGLMTAAQNKTGACSYAYGTDGLLVSRSNPFGPTTITRDNRGNIIREMLANKAVESLSWHPNNCLASYSIADPSGALVSETRNYAYDEASRVVQEPFTSAGQGTQIANYLFDQNPLISGSSQTKGLGVRTSELVDGNGINEVSALDIFSRVTQSQDVNSDSTMSYDAAGEVTSRGLSSGTAQNLTWDGFGRLVEVDQRDSNNQGYNWVTVYDGLGRRIQTAYSDTTEKQTTSLPLNIYYYYDPEVPFLEIGRDYNGRTWNLFGPDRSGFYGGAQGIGGMETTYAENGRETYGILKNFFGDSLGNMNALGLYAWGNVLGGYGAMPGSSVNADLVPQWRGHYLDWTGLYYFGARYYDPTEGRFISADPLGHDTSMSLYDYCNGDPINELDPDGMDAVALGHGWYYFVMHDNHRMDALNLHFINNKNSDYSEQCATGAQFLTGTFINGNFYDAPSTRTWRQGNPVGPNTPLGTMIATGWINGRYPSAPPSAYAEGGRLAGQTMNHTGIFKGMNPDGKIKVFDQFIGKPLGITPYHKEAWNIVTSDQKYDPCASESFEGDQKSAPHSTIKSCGH